jgi:hypothetical protein
MFGLGNERHRAHIMNAIGHAINNLSQSGRPIAEGSTGKLTIRWRAGTTHLQIMETCDQLAPLIFQMTKPRSFEAFGELLENLKTSRSKRRKS